MILTCQPSRVEFTFAANDTNIQMDERDSSGSPILQRSDEKKVLNNVFYPSVEDQIALQQKKNIDLLRHKITKRPKPFTHPAFQTENKSIEIDSPTEYLYNPMDGGIMASDYRGAITEHTVPKECTGNSSQPGIMKSILMKSRAFMSKILPSKEKLISFFSKFSTPLHIRLSDILVPVRSEENEASQIDNKKEEEDVNISKLNDIIIKIDPTYFENKSKKVQDSPKNTRAADPVQNIDKLLSHDRAKGKNFLDTMKSDISIVGEHKIQVDYQENRETLQRTRKTHHRGNKGMSHRKMKRSTWNQ